MKIPQILTTSNYDLFKPHGEQQAMQPRHVKKLIKSMTDCGFIAANPIHVYRDGKFLRVIDGHHRLRAAQTLGIPVYYIIGTKEDAWLIAPKNWAVRTWQADAFVNMYASRGLKDYKLITAYEQRGLSMKFAIALLSGETTGSNNKNEAIRNGTFKVKTTKHADAVLEIIDAVSPINQEAKSNNFISAIAVLIRLPQFAPDQLIARIKSNPGSLTKCATREQMFEMLEDIYNFRSREKTPLAFQASAFLAERQKAMK